MDKASCGIESMAGQHVDAVHGLALHPSLPRTSSVPPDCPRAHVQGWVDANQDPIRRTLSFVILDKGEPAGIVALKRLDAGDNSGEIAYWLGAPFRGRGLATAAASQAIAYAFGTLGLDYLHSHFLRLGNPQSRRVLEKAGFRSDPGRADLSVEAAGPDDRFALAFPGDHWHFVRLDRPAGP